MKRACPEIEWADVAAGSSEAMRAAISASSRVAGTDARGRAAASRNGAPLPRTGARARVGRWDRADERTGERGRHAMVAPDARGLGLAPLAAIGRPRALPASLAIGRR